MPTCDDKNDPRVLFAAAAEGCSGGPWLCMVSGGSDSTALAYLAVEAARRQGRPVALFHANHHLRGADADEDAAFVARLADCLEVPLFTADLALEAALADGENLEALARRQRYDAAYAALERWCGENGAASEQGTLLAAHTLDDRVENLYMRTLVGTGPGGFRGMARRDGRLWRPLLDATRVALRAYLAELPEAVVDGRSGFRWCEDQTNNDTDRLRAFVRHELIPLAETRSPALKTVLGRTMDLIADEDEYMETLADELAAEHLVWLGSNGAALPAPSAGFQLDPAFGQVARPLARRVVHAALAAMAGQDERVDTRAVEAVLAAYRDGVPISGYVTNIQGNLAVSANKRGVRVEPMDVYRARRKPGRVQDARSVSKGTADE